MSATTHGLLVDVEDLKLTYQFVKIARYDRCEVHTAAQNRLRKSAMLQNTTGYG